MLAADITIREAKFDDSNEILHLLNTVFSKQQKSMSLGRDESFWKWKYEQNVFENATLHVAELEGKIIAAGTMWPWEFKTRNSILKAYQPCDTVVTKEARGLGVFSKLNEARIHFATSRNVDFIFNFPNQNSLSGYLRMGWTYVGKVPWMVKIMKPIPVVSSFFSKNQSIKLNIPASYKIDLNK